MTDGLRYVEIGRDLHTAASLKKSYPAGRAQREDLDSRPRSTRVFEAVPAGRFWICETRLFCKDAASGHRGPDSILAELCANTPAADQEKAAKAEIQVLKPEGASIEEALCSVHFKLCLACHLQAFG